MSFSLSQKPLSYGTLVAARHLPLGKRTTHFGSWERESELPPEDRGRNMWNVKQDSGANKVTHRQRQDVTQRDTRVVLLSA